MNRGNWNKWFYFAALPGKSIQTFTYPFFANPMGTAIHTCAGVGNKRSSGNNHTFFSAFQTLRIYSTNYNEVLYIICKPAQFPVIRGIIAKDSPNAAVNETAESINMNAT